LNRLLTISKDKTGKKRPRQRALIHKNFHKTIAKLSQDRWASWLKIVVAVLRILMFLKSFLKKRVKQLITDKKIKNGKNKTVCIRFVLSYLKGLKNCSNKSTFLL